MQISVVKLVEDLQEDTMVLFNSILFEQRVVFLGHTLVAGDVASYVLSTACLFPAGSLLRQRIYPYVSFDDLTFLEHEGYIIGVCNPMFRSKTVWFDLLVDLSDMQLVTPDSKKKDDDDDISPSKRDLLFIHKIMAKIQIHKKENKDLLELEDIVRGMFRDYLQDIIDIAMENVNTRDFVVAEHRLFKQSTKDSKSNKGSEKRHSIEDLDEQQMVTAVHQLANSGAPSSQPQSSSSHASDRYMKKKRLKKYTNYFKAIRWRGTESFKQYQQTQGAISTDEGVYHDALKLRYTTSLLSDSELKNIFQKFLNSVQTHDQIIEFLSFFPESREGLYPVAVGLFHPELSVRTWVLALLNKLENVKEGHASLMRLNKFIMLAYGTLKKKQAVVQ